MGLVKDSPATSTDRVEDLATEPFATPTLNAGEKLTALSILPL